MTHLGACHLHDRWRREGFHACQAEAPLNYGIDGGKARSVQLCGIGSLLCTPHVYETTRFVMQLQLQGDELVNLLAHAPKARIGRLLFQPWP